MPSDVMTPGSNNLRNRRGLSLAGICLVLNLTAVESLPFGYPRANPCWKTSNQEEPP